jgi:hypothetical protein
VVQNLSPLVFLLIATILEVSGDALSEKAFTTTPVWFA